MDLEPLLQHRAVDEARARVHQDDPRTIAEQLELVAIPAPPFGEAERAEAVRERFERYGLADVSTDEVGNVLGWFGASEDRAAPPVVVSAHVDTIFPTGTSVSVRRRGNRIYAPGISDNTRGLAALLALARALTAAGVRTRNPVVFAATVGEEGTGDLRGVKHLFRDPGPWRRTGAFLSLDGPGLRRIVHRAVGSRRWRVVVDGPGGHSWADRGAPNPIHALGRAVAAIHALASGNCALSVGRIGGGTSVNAIPEQAWMEIDLRSETAGRVAIIQREMLREIERAIDAENAGPPPESARLTLRVEPIGDRPAGSTPADSDLVRAAVAATRAVGARPELASASTDANVPMALGIPAVTLGAGGEGGNVHTTGEWYANRGGARGIDRALLVALAMAGVLPA